MKMRQDKRNLTSDCLGALLLLVVFSVCFTSVLARTFDDVVKTEVSRHDDGDHSFPVGINLKESNRKKRAILMTALAVGAAAIAVTDLVTANVRQSFDSSADDRDHQEIIDHFEQIQMELEKQTEELQSINQEIKNLGLSIIYFEHEDKIKYSLLILIEYLRHPNDRNLNVFIEKAVHLDQSIRILVDGLLGQHSFSHDIMVIMRDAAKCHGQKFRKKVKSIESLIMTGLYVRGQYKRITNSTEGDSSPFQKYIETSLPKLKTRFDDMAIECQADETNVSNEMRKIMEATLTPNRQNLTNALLNFLEEKYDTKWWLIIIQNKNSENSVWSSGFHHVSVRNDVAFAISVDRRTERIPIGTSFNFDFGFPLLWCSYSKPNGCSSSVKIENYLNRFLIPARARSEVETKTFVFADKMAWQNSYAMSKNLTIYFESIPISLPLKWTKVVGVIVVLRRPAISFNPSPSPSHSRNQMECSYDPDQAAQDYGPLRNERAHSYLSVQGDSSEEGASIILDRQWRNSSGQKWKFVDGQLRNGFGKCLTWWSNADSRSFRHIYQSNCEPNWPDQKWDRHGLHIVNGMSLYLVFDGKLDQNPMFVRVAVGCDLSPSHLWYNRDTNCEDAMVIPATTNGSRPLRNELSRLFLDVVGDYGTEQPWNNRPRQLWKFVDHDLLKNDHGECLITGPGRQVRTIKCINDQLSVMKFGNFARWTYTKNRQIKNKMSGHCLSSAGDEHDYVYSDPCRDEPRQRWWYYS